jgi:hypothetical protein
MSLIEGVEGQKRRQRRSKKYVAKQKEEGNSQSRLREKKLA